MKAFVAFVFCCTAMAQAPCSVGSARAVITAPHADGSPRLIADDASSVWRNTATAVIHKDCSKVLDWPELRTTVRAFWTDTHLYLLFRCPYRQLNVFLPRQGGGDRDKLWDRDVVEIFLGADWRDIGRYREFEIAPTGDHVDLAIDYYGKHFEESWDSGWDTDARIDEPQRVWYAAARIPLRAVSSDAIAPGTRWRMNLYRIDGIGPDPVRHFLCWQPTCVKDRDPNHVPEHFGTLVFGN